MFKNIKWGNKELPGVSHDELNELTSAKLTRIENGQNAVSSGQLASVCSKGGTSAMPKGVYTDTQKKGNKVAYELGVGIHNKNNENYKKWKSEAGKKGGTKSKNANNGIHVDLETRKKWARLGGLVQVKNLNVDKTCPHCNLVSRGAGYNRWHGDKCKNKI